VHPQTDTGVLTIHDIFERRKIRRGIIAGPFVVQRVEHSADSGAIELVRRDRFRGVAQNCLFHLVQKAGGTWRGGRSLRGGTVAPENAGHHTGAIDRGKRENRAPDTNPS
jgi:hypothetical protein